MSASPCLRVRDLTMRFGSVTAFRDVSFEVDAGELFAIIGPNGAGKTTLFNVLSRVYEPTTGTMHLEGRDLATLRPSDLARHGVARTFQNLGVFPHMTVEENVLVGRHHLARTGALLGGLWVGPVRRDEARHRAAADEALAFVGLDGRGGDIVGELPYGLQKRVELARALAMEPSFLLLDEPVAGMDAEERAQITELVTRMHRERGLTILLVEHDMGMVMRVAQRVLVLDFGEVVACGTPAEVQRDERVIRAYLGAELEGAA